MAPPAAERRRPSVQRQLSQKAFSAAKNVVPTKAMSKAFSFKRLSWNPLAKNTVISPRTSRPSTPVTTEPAPSDTTSDAGAIEPSFSAAPSTPPKAVKTEPEPDTPGISPDYPKTPPETPAKDGEKSMIESLLEWATSPFRDEPQPEAPPAVAEFEVIKEGVPWRGSYSRLLRIGEGKVVTLEPGSLRETNAWESPRDVPRAVTSDGGATIELHFAMIPECAWPMGKLRLGVTPAEAEALVEALRREGVEVEAA